MQNDLELHYANLENQYNATFKFYSDNYFIRFLKILTIIIFFIPTILMSLIVVAILIIHALLKYIPIIGIISGAIAGLASAVLAVFFDACNLPELTEYREHRKIVNADELAQEKITQSVPQSSHQQNQQYHISADAQLLINNTINELSLKIDNLFVTIESQELFNEIKNDTINSIREMTLETPYEFIASIKDINMDYWAFTSISGQILTMILSDSILEEFNHLNFNQALGLSKLALADLHYSCAKIALDNNIITEDDFNDLNDAIVNML